MALTFFIAFPMLFVTIFSFVLSGVGSGDNRLELCVVTREVESGISHQLIAAISSGNESQLEPGEPKIVPLDNYSDARQEVENEEIDGFLAFPSNFTVNLFSGGHIDLEIVVNPEDTNTRAALNGLAGSIASRIVAQRITATAVVELLIENGQIEPNDEKAINEIVQQVISNNGDPLSERSFIEFDIESIGEVKPENAANFVIPGYLVMFVFFAAALAAEMIVRERQNHTLERLLSSSVKREALLGGIFAGTTAKGLIQIAIFWAIGILAFNIDLGISPVATIVLSILMVIMSSAFGIMLATFVKTQKSAGSIAVLVSLVLAPLGGCWWPLFITPPWMQFLGKLTPHGWATTGFNKLMVFGADFGDVVPEMLVLLGFAIVFVVVGAVRFRIAAA